MCVPLISSKISSFKQSTNENDIFTQTSKYIIGKYLIQFINNI